MKTILQTMGSCTDVENPTESIDIFARAIEEGRPFQVVTLDIRMPDMDGTQVLYRLREIEEAKGVSEMERAKIFMVTSQSDKDSIITCLQAGCDGFIVKPFTLKTLIEKFMAQGIWLGR